MADRKKVIEALDCCLDIVKSGRWASGCISCPYAEEKNNCREKMIKDAIALLKEQQTEIDILKLMGLRVPEQLELTDKPIFKD